MSLTSLFRGRRLPRGEVFLTYTLDGTEVVSYGETDQVVDQLQAVGAALALFPIKDDSPDTPLLRSMYELTDGMTAEQVSEALDSVVDLMDALTKGREMAYHATGTIKINPVGALLNWSDTDIGFPFQGATGGMPGGYTQQRRAERVGDDLHLRLVVDGGQELASVCTWIIAQSRGQISFTLKEARYWQVRDYGRVLLNQVIEASGTLSG